MPPKKKNRNLDDWEKDFAALDENGELKEPEEALTKPVTKTKKKDKKKGKKAAAFDSDDEAVPAVLTPAAGAAGVESEDDEPTIGPTKASRGRKAAPVSVFELLGEEDEGSGAEGEEEEAAEEEEVAEEEEGKGATDETPELRPVPIVAKIVGLKQHPKADRLRVVKLAAGPLLGDVQVVTNAPNLTKQQLVALAPVGCKTPGTGMEIAHTKLRGVESAGMICSAQDLDAEEETMLELESKKKRKGKKSKAATDALFAALAGALTLGADELQLGPKKKSKKKTARAELDLDALLADNGGDKAVTPLTEPTPSETSKGKDREKEEPAASDAELDALLAEIDAPAPAAPVPAPTGGGKKKKKGKGGKGKADGEEEDLDALLAELGVELPASAAGVGSAAASAPGGPSDATEENGGGGEGGPATSAAAKRRAKKKARDAAKKSGGAVEAEGGEEPAAEESSEPASASAKGGKKGAPKVSAAVKRMQAALEAQRRAAEEAARLAEEQRLREEEEERAAEEAERQKAEAAERRKAEKLARREQLKKEGKLLTGKAKAEAERLARVREQFLKQAGIDVDAGAPKKKPVYTNRKRTQPRKQVNPEAEGPVSAAAEEEPAPAPEPESEVPADEPAAPADEPVEGAVEETWEATVDDWEAMDEDTLVLPGQQPAAPVATAAGTPQAEVAEQNGEAATSEKAVEEAVAEEEESDEEEEEGETSSSDASESGSGTETESESESESSSEYSSSEEESTDSEAEMEERIAAQREKRAERRKLAMALRNPADLRSPICCILGHVDTGKTKILDNIRRTNVQDGEAGGITQQIGATYIPGDAILTRTEELRRGKSFDLKLPGLLVIDTPGHESFSNLRSRGSGLCDIAVLVVDLMHGLEQQTIESLNLLRMRKTPFVIAMNKVDRLYGWKSVPNSPIIDALERQAEHVCTEFEQRMDKIMLQLNEQGMNVALYWRNKDPRSFISIVPTSAHTGEGIPDLLQILVKLTQTAMAEKLTFVNDLQCTVLEVKSIEGLGTTIDVVLINGQLQEGDTIVVCGLGGAIVTPIRALLTPQPLREMRVKGTYVHHKEVRAAMGIKLAAHNLETAVAGTQLFVVRPDDDLEALKAEVMEDMQDIFASVDKTGEGVCVQASTLGSLEALLAFLKTPEVNIAVSAINIGPVHKRDVMRANVMIERGVKKYGVILAFDVPVNKEAREMAEELGVNIFTADIIYHLFDQFTAYLKHVKEEEQEAARLEAVFPCVLRIMPTCVFNKKDPIVVGVEIAEGIARIGTPICVPSQGGFELGRIASMEKDHKAVDTAKRGDAVAMKIEATNPDQAARLYGRHFDHKDDLVSKITRKSINVLKDMFRDDLTKDDWRLVVRLKKVFNID
ncbi:Eukaryotic translation initiation factor 5B [Auxenochlorella protothecoides]|uniref:Eukaryotic translation initiation factor 5B n=1 Tax=Auxenochlorella protothecoides TaxID=3075 RepID=A0A087SF12_AUXPR|nr:Eukaryotic translation initiation factor 5B [Auxenochlorella protothecoides]KFM24316.1 Eukaryotic translation initiation factor 5B [Auxenochlorella protothecoides]